jgi:hypothetical protein
VRCITKENTINRPSLKLVQLLPFLKDKALATKDMEVTQLGCATVHQLVAGFLLMHFEVDPIRNIACGIHRLSPESSLSPMLMNFLAPGSRDMFDANNKAVDYLFRALCQPETDRVHTESLACRIWSVLKVAHVGNAQVQAQQQRVGPYFQVLAQVLAGYSFLSEQAIASISCAR